MLLTFIENVYCAETGNGNNIDAFLKSKQKYIEVIDVGFKLVCDQEICLSEAQKCIRSTRQ